MKLNMMIFFGMAYFFSAFFASVVFADSGMTGEIQVQVENSRVTLVGPESVLESEILELQNLKFRFNEEDICQPQSSCEGELCSADVTDCLAKTYQGVLAKKFGVNGPNCFSTVMKLSGFNPTFRGVDTGEFTAFTKLKCKEVSEPVIGDIGVFETPKYGFVHAYIYLTSSLGMDKADFKKQSAIRVHRLSEIEFTYAASKECRENGGDSKDCYNNHYYLRCEGFSPSGSALKAHLEKVHEIEKSMEQVLSSNRYSKADIDQVFSIELNVKNLILSYESNQDLQKQLKEKEKRYVEEQLKSLKIQSEFLVERARKS